MKLAVPSQVSAVDVPTTFAVPQGKDKITTDNHAMIAMANITAGGAGLFSIGQIFNPAASGKSIYLDRVRTMQPGLGDRYFFGGTTVARPTLNSGAGNKNSGAAAGVGEVRSEKTAVALPNTFACAQCAGGVDLVVEFDPPIKLDAGEGIDVQPVNANTTQIITFEWREY